MSNAEPWTIKRLLTWTTQYLQENGSESARLDAEVLLAEAMNCKRIELYTSYDVQPPEDVLGKFRGWIRDRATGCPVAYLVGHREFYSIDFKVNRDVLIPRPETELLVTLAIDHLRSLPQDNLRVLDLGTGSGCIPIAIAKNFPQCSFVAVDISTKALQVAAENAADLGVADRIDFLESDLFGAIPESQEFDLIVSNPPYIGESERDKLARDVRDYEPDVALFSGDDGLMAIKELIAVAPDFLRPKGVLMFELSPIIAEDCLQLASHHDGYSQARLESDLAKHPRVLVANRK